MFSSVRFWFLLVGLLSMAFVIASAAFGDPAIFSGGRDSGRAVLQLLAGVEGTLVVLVVTVAFVLAELTSPISSRLLRQIFASRYFISCVVSLLIFLAYDLVTVARLDVYLPVGDVINSRWVDAGVAMAVFSALLVGLFIWNAPKQASALHMARRELWRLSPDTIQAIASPWKSQVTPYFRDEDPMYAIERVLIRSLEARESAVLMPLISDLYNHLRGLESNRIGGDIDRYLAIHLSDFLNLAAAQRREDVLGYFLDLANEEVLKTDPESTLRSISSQDSPEGEWLIRGIVAASMRGSLEKAATEALGSVGRRAVQLMTHLPPEEDTSMFLEPMQRHAADQAQLRKGQRNDEILWDFERSHISYFRNEGRSALTIHLQDASQQCCHSLIRIMEGALELPGQKRRAYVFRNTLASYLLLCEEALQTRQFGGLTMFGLHRVFEGMDSEADLEMAKVLHQNLARTSRELARRGAFSTTVMDYSRAVQGLGERFPALHASAITEMGAVAKILQDAIQQGDETRALPYQRIITELKHQRATTVANAEAVKRALSEVSHELGESLEPAT